MAAPTHRRPFRVRRRTAVVSVAAVAVAVLVVSLVVALRPGGGAGSVRADGKPVAADGRGSDAPTPSKPKQSSASPTAPTAPASTASSSAAATATASPAARSSATRSSAGGAPGSAPRSGSDSAPLAGRIKPGVGYEGVATHYDAADGDGACTYGPSPDLMVAAMNTADYETSKACGAYLLVRAGGGASVTVRVTNECPAPCAAGQLDLSEQAFAKLAALSAGRIQITWSLLSPDTSDTVSIRYKTGSTRYWCGIQAIGHRNPLARLEVGTGGGWTSLTRTEYNYFLSPDGTGCGGPIRLTDIYGEQLTVDALAVRPDTVQQTGVQFARH
ncbi:expansin EXLX1 family cellulose-binding protein [Streptomyces sp. NPDC059785]|uniref:expansin EXLX1 family cellulose-binding protein n=1 Tax=Streptomyces sp. NPDC059785 TaxID=3346945 RepID=UPI003659CB8C